MKKKMSRKESFLFFERMKEWGVDLRLDTLRARKAKSGK